ncbi:MAG TPA: cation transporter [Egibacteraceae bacterium]|nr:cation transporter [Egibacteraceae bacterium]
MKQEVISVPEIHCGHCKAAIEGALQPLDGVETATVDVADATVSVSYDPDTVSRTDLVAVIEEQGYEVPA